MGFRADFSVDADFGDSSRPFSLSIDDSTLCGLFRWNSDDDLGCIFDCKKNVELYSFAIRQFDGGAIKN